MSEKSRNKTALILCVQEVKEDGSSMNLGNQLSSDDVMFLHQAFIADSLVNALSLPKTDIKLYYSPKPKTRLSIDTILDYLKNRYKGKSSAILEGGHLEVTELGPGRWGEKMDESFRRCFDQGYKKVLFVGSRTPTLTSGMLLNAAKILSKKDLVFGPTVEGRYYLIGFSRNYHFPLVW